MNIQNDVDFSNITVNHFCLLCNKTFQNGMLNTDLCPECET